MFKIDKLISNECFFCGPILLDMIDNDVEFEGKGSEFSSSQVKKQPVVKSEWDFI